VRFPHNRTAFALLTWAAALSACVRFSSAQSEIPPPDLDSIESRVPAMACEPPSSGKASPELGTLRPTFQLGGQMQVDYLWVGQDAENRKTVGDVNDAVDIRRARLAGRGEMGDIIEYTIGLDFALSGRPTLLDAWAGVRDVPFLGNVRVGHFFEPFSLERLTQNQRHTFMERSLADAFAPARNTGIEAYDSFGDGDRATYAIGWFASSSDAYGQQFTDTGGQAITARITGLPIWDDLTNGRYFLHWGAAYSFRTPPSGTFAFASFPEARSGTPTADNMPPFVDTGPIEASHAQHFGVELAWVAGPLSVQSEYIIVSLDRASGPDPVLDAAYVQVGYFLTGENRTYNKAFGIMDRVFPFNDMARAGTGAGASWAGSGAWEIAARGSYIDLEDANVQGGAMNDLTIGLNWYLNAYSRVRWELVQANLDRAPVGRSRAWIAGMRFDVDF